LSARQATGHKALVLQHRDHEPGGVLLDVLRAKGLDPVVVRVDRSERLPDPDAAPLAVVLGSDRSAAWADAELDWLRRADATGISVLALGSGAALLATALGGGVARRRQPRRGWVQFTTADPKLISAGPWLAWEDEIIRLPHEAELLAHDRVGPQAFRMNGHLGLQFHPEVTPEIVEDWVASSHQVLDVQGTMEATWRDFRVASEAARRMFSAFIDSAGERRR
jgi:GMP synthase-like glutamine amidotransferase